MSEPQQQVNKTSVLVVCALGSFMTTFMSSSINIALPAIQEQFHMQAVMLSWVTAVFLLAAAVGMVPAGRLGDMYGRKRIFIWGMALYSLSSLSCGLAVSTAMMIVSRITQGVGVAMIYATTMAMVTSAFPLNERGRAIGMTVSMTYAGLTLGPVIGGFLTGSFGWASLFFVNAILGVPVIVLMIAKVKIEWADARGEKFDLGGSLIYGLGLIALMYGLTVLTETIGIILAITGLICLVGFYYWERRCSYPVLNMSLFTRNKVFAMSSLAALINYAATAGLVFLLSLYLQNIKAMSPEHVGVILITMPLVMTVFAPIAGRLSDRIAPQFVASLGMFLIGLSILRLAFLHHDSSIVVLVVNLAFLGLGFALFSSPNTNAVMSAVEKRQLGIASATVSTMRLVGQMLSMGMIALIFSLVIGPVKIGPDVFPQFLKSVQIAFVLFGVLSLIGAFPAMVRGGVRKEGRRP